MLNKLPPGVCWRGGGGGGGATGLLNKGGGSNRLPGLVNNKLWNFHRYRLVLLIVHEDKHHLDIIRQYMWK